MAGYRDTVDEFQRLKQSIQRQSLDNLYVLWGEETFLLLHYRDCVQKILIDPLTESFNLHQFNNENFRMESFLDAIENLPMMAEHSMVLLEDIDIFALPESDRDTLVKIFRSVPDYCTILFTYIPGGWKPDKRKKKLWDALSENGHLVEFTTQEPKELIPWVSRHFQTHKKSISKALCEYLIELTNGSMSALLSEIEKISAFSESKEIQKTDIDAVTEPVLDVIVFQMTEQLGNGQYSQALLQIQQLLKMQQEPLAILGAIGSQYRRLYAARVLYERGKGSRELSSMYSLYDSAARKITDSARKTQKRFLGKALILIAESDYLIKNSVDEPERVLELLVMRLAGEAVHG